MLNISKELYYNLIGQREFKNIFLSFAFRIAAILCNFLIVPLLVNQLSNTEYGILITIISISTWFTFVDFGIANGLKNRISESLAKNEISNVRKYITSAYYALFKVVLVLTIVLIFFNFFINWNKIIKGPDNLDQAINKIFFYGLLLFFIRMLVELINPILLAYHKTYMSSLIAFIAQFSILAISFILKFNGIHSFLIFGLLFFLVPLLIYSISNFYFYSTSLKNVRPSNEFFDKSYQKNLFKVGGGFFVIQLAYLIIFMTDNLIIGRIFNYSEVSSYNIAFRYFNIPTFVLSVIITPYWPIFAESYVKQEIGRIKIIMKKLLLIWLLLVVVTFIMLLIAPIVYSIWVGDRIKVSFLLNLGMFFTTIITAWNSIFATFINSTSKLKLQTYSAIIIGIVNIPLCIFLSEQTNLGSAGVILGTVICLVTGSVWAPVQYYKLINQKAIGIWNK